MIRETLLREHSKQNTLRIVEYVGDNPSHLKELLTIFSEQNHRLSQRAAWPLSCIAEQHPEFITPHLKLIVGLLKNPSHDAIKRNVVRLLQYVKIPESLCGLVADYCFGYLRAEYEPIAVRAFSMQVLANLCERYPELKHELIPLIEDIIPLGSPGIKNRGKKILIRLNSLSD